MAGSWHFGAARRHLAGSAGLRGLLAAAGMLLLAAAHAAAGVAWQAPQEVARGAGQRGAWQQNDSRYDFVDDPAAAWSRRGELALAWVDQRRKAVLLQRYAGDGSTPRGAPVEVSRSAATFSWLPRLAWAPDDDDRLYVLWQEIVFSGGSHGGEIFVAVSRDGGRSFGAPLNLSNSRAGDGKGRLHRDTWDNGSFDIVAAPGGRVFASWTEFDGRLWLARSENGGRSFAKPQLLAGTPPRPPARGPSLAVAPDGAVVVAWATGEQPAADIWVARSQDGGLRFDAPRRAAITSGRSDAPKLAFDKRGTLHLVHAERCGEGTPPACSVIRHLRSGDGGRSFGEASEISAPASALPAGVVGAAFPAIGIDGRGRVVVVWELLRGRTAALAPYGLGIAVSDDGVRFHAATEVPASSDAAGGLNGSSQGLLMNKLALRSDGQIALVNSALKPGSHSRVWLLRGALR